MPKAEEPPKNKRLGRGLAKLIGDASVAEAVNNAEAAENTVGARKADGTRFAPVESLAANPRNPRKKFSEDELAELAGSIKEKGIIQPILVRNAPNSAELYEIIAGERRWRAAQKAGIHDVPIVVRQVTDQEALELAIIENIQRADLNPVEEAEGFDRLITEYSYTHSYLAKIVGKSRSQVANTLRLLKLPKAVKKSLTDGLLTTGHARALVGAENAEALAKIIVDKGLNVRDTEKLAQSRDAVLKAGPASKATEKDADIRALEKNLSDGLGLKIAIQHKRSGKGEMRIKYNSLEQFDGICKILGYSS